MKKITVEDLLKARDEDGLGLLNIDLIDHAATDAAKVLAVNWVDAVRDGVDVPHLTNDVDEVVSLLLTWKRAVLNTFG